MSLLPTTLDFSKRYSDDSGVEQSVRLSLDDVDAEIQFKRWESKVTFPIDQLDWIIDALARIKEEVGP